jgi:hypothetical protein
MSIAAREYEHSIATQAAEKLYHTVIADLKPLLNGETVPNVADAKRLVALAVSCGRDSQSFEKKGTHSLLSLSACCIFATVLEGTGLCNFSLPLASKSDEINNVLCFWRMQSSTI